MNPRIKPIVSAMLALALNALAAAAQAAPPDREDLERALEFVIAPDMGTKLNAMQWQMKAGSEGRPILSGNHYQLVNMAIDRGLMRQKRAKAANLGFLDEGSGVFNMLVKRKAGDGQVRYGDTVALNLKPYGWLRYKKQGNWGGINLSDDDVNPHYIWQVRGGRDGDKLVSGMPFALLNLDPMRTEIIYCQRSAGIDLGWRGKSKCGGAMSKISAKAFGANGALSGDGLSGKLATRWKERLCQGGVGASAAFLTAQSGGLAAAGVAAAAKKAIEKCSAL